MFLAISATTVVQMAVIAAQFTQGASKWMQALTQGIQSKQSQVVNSVKQVMLECAQAARDYSDRFESAGRQAMAGLAQGIRDGGSGAINAASNVARRALQAAKSELDIASPSKKFEEVGRYSDEGLAQGFTKFGSIVYQAARNVSSNALAGVQDEMSNASGAIGTLSARVSPVLTGANAKLFTGSSLSANIRTDSLDSGIATLSQLITANDAAITRSNQELKSTIESLKTDMTNLGEEIKNIKLGFYVDSKELAKATAKPMNRQLQILSKRGSL